MRTLAAVLFAGMAVELVLMGHTEDPAQLIPFALCALGRGAVAADWLRPARMTAVALRG